MQIKLHKESWIAIVASHVQIWRESQDWSRETVAEAIVNKYVELYPRGLPGIEKFSDHSDIFTRNTTNSARIFRWLDDFQKDKNLLGANFLPVILQAMPNDLRIRCINEMLRSMNLVASAVDVGLEDESIEKPLSHLKALIKEGAEACQAITALLDGATPDEWVSAQQELIQLEEVVRKARALVDPQVAALNVQPIQGKK